MVMAYCITLFVMSIITAIVYSYDFSVAVGQWERKGRARIPEYVLITLAAIGGGLGAWITMQVQRHKASEGKKYFRFVINSAIVINVITLIMLIFK